MPRRSWRGAEPSCWSTLGGDESAENITPDTVAVGARHHSITHLREPQGASTPTPSRPIFGWALLQGDCGSPDSIRCVIDQPHHAGRFVRTSFPVEQHQPCYVYPLYHSPVGDQEATTQIEQYEFQQIYHKYVIWGIPHDGSAGHDGTRVVVSWGVGTPEIGKPHGEVGAQKEVVGLPRSRLCTSFVLWKPPYVLTYFVPDSPRCQDSSLSGDVIEAPTWGGRQQ